MRVLRPLVAAVLCVGAGCTPPTPELLQGRRDVRAPLLEGRSFDLLVFDEEGELTRTRRLIGGDGPDVFDEVVGTVMAACEVEVGINTRLDTEYQPGGAAQVQTCGIEAARDQQRLLCAAHYLAMFAQAVTPVDVFADEQTSAFVIHVRRAGESDPFGPTGPGQGLPHRFSIPVQDSSGKATLALISTTLFQASALEGAYALDPNTCPDTTLYGTVPAQRDAEAPSGWSDERVPLAFVVTASTAEGAQQMLDMASEAEQAILAASARLLADDRDRGRGTGADHGLSVWAC